MTLQMKTSFVRANILIIIFCIAKDKGLFGTIYWVFQKFVRIYGFAFFCCFNIYSNYPYKYKVYYFLLIFHLIIQIISNHNARLYS